MMKKPEKSLPGMIKIAFLIPAVLVTLGLTTGMSPQEKTIKGKVVIAESGEPAPGANVLIQGTTTGTVTDLNGDFTLYVEGNPDIVVSFVGYATIKVKAGEAGKNPLGLEPETYQMDLETIPNKVPKEEEEATNSIRIVGEGDNQPVFIVDGQKVDDISQLDPDMIERIEVYKDPNDNMAKKYHAANGVVVVTLKRKLSSSEKIQVEEMQQGEEGYYIVEELPEFPGGRAALKTYIYSNLEYPESARKKGISGEVSVQFNVTAKGKLEDIEVASSTHKEFEKPALNVFKEMPDWTPGKQRGKAVKVKIIVPVKFNTDAE